MGICTSCCEDPQSSLLSPHDRKEPQNRQPRSEPDSETKRHLQAEAAEKRQRELEGRGVADPEKLKRQRRKKEELERAQALAGPPSQDGLRWTTG